MKFRRRYNSALRVGIESTPLIDVMFLLTIFFMLTSTVIKTSSINVNLPRSITSDSQPKTQINITITKTGEIFLNDYKVSIDDIPSAIRKVVIKDPTIPVIIRGDKDLQYQFIIDVMDKVRIGGATEVSLLVDKR